MSEPIHYEIRPRALRLRALNLVLLSLVPVIPYVFYLHHVGSQLPDDAVIDNSFRLILTGGLGSVIWVMVCLFAVPDLWAEDWSITIGDGWIELPKAGRIHASDIAGVRSVRGLVHSRIEIELESDHPDSETIPAVYPHEYGGGHDLNPRIFSLWDQHRHRNDDRPQGSAMAPQRTRATKFYYACSNDGHSQPDGYTYEEALAAFQPTTFIRCDLDEDWTPLKDHPDFRGVAIQSINRRSPPKPEDIRKNDVVQITKVTSDLSDSTDWNPGPMPAVGEDAVVLEVLADGAFILENVDDSGETRWLGCVTTDDVELLVVWSSETHPRT